MMRSVILVIDTRFWNSEDFTTTPSCLSNYISSDSFLPLELPGLIEPIRDISQYSYTGFESTTASPPRQSGSRGEKPRQCNIVNCFNIST